MYLLSEDEALKVKLSDLSVTATNDSPIPVMVRFANSEDEFAKITYPLIVITHHSISEAPERRHEGFIELNYAPDGYPDADIEHDPHTGLFSFYPLPVNLDYVITTYSRTSQHDRQLTAALAQFDYLPPRYGYLAIPQTQDGTIRRLDLLEGPTAQEIRDNDNKRMFRQVYFIRVSSEILMPITQFTDVSTIDIEMQQTLDSYWGQN